MARDITAVAKKMTERMQPPPPPVVEKKAVNRHKPGICRICGGSTSQVRYATCAACHAAKRSCCPLCGKVVGRYSRTGVCVDCNRSKNGKEARQRHAASLAKTKAEVNPNCQHRWIIPSVSDGTGTYVGKCKRCKSKREFKPWEGQG